MLSTTQYLTICTNTWLQCENLLLQIATKKTSYSHRTVQVLDECANICLGTMEAVKEGWSELSQIALLCVGLCEECAEVCERYADNAFQSCADACKTCSATLSHLASNAA